MPPPVHAAAPMHAPAAVAMTAAASTPAASDLRQKVVAHVGGRVRAAENLDRFGLRRGESAKRHNDERALDETKFSHGLSSPCCDPNAASIRGKRDARRWTDVSGFG